jgi:hypothetical protein
MEKVWEEVQCLGVMMEFSSMFVVIVVCCIHCQNSKNHADKKQFCPNKVGFKMSLQLPKNW